MRAVGFFAFLTRNLRYVSLNKKLAEMNGAVSRVSFRKVC